MPASGYRAGVTPRLARPQDQPRDRAADEGGGEAVDRADDQLGDEAAQREPEEGDEPTKPVPGPPRRTCGFVIVKLHDCS